MPRAGVLPYPSEAEAEAIFKPRQIFSLACMLAGLFIDTYLLAWVTECQRPKAAPDQHSINPRGIFLMLLLRYIQSNHQKSDTNWTRLCVIGASIGTLTATGYQWWLASHRFVYNFGRFQPFFEATPGSWFPLLDCITALFTQSFFTHRAFLLNGRNWFIVVASVLLMSGSLACTIAVKIIFASLSSSRDAGFVYVPTVVWLSMTTTTDIIITSAILVGLINSRTGWSKTNRLISRLVRLTLEAQIPATLSAIIYLSAFLTKLTSPVSIAIVYFQSKLYAIGLLYSLNARKSLQGIGRSQLNDTSSHDDFWSPRVTAAHLRGTPASPGAPGLAGAIEMGSVVKSR